VTLDELLKELRGGRIRGAYLLAGAEALVRDDALAALGSAVLAGAPREFDSDRLDGETATAGGLVDALHTLPVLAPRRLVILREPEARKAAARALVEAIPDLVQELGAQSGPRGAVLVVCAAQVDRRAAWVKAFREPAALVECEAPTRAPELVGFVRAEAKRQGVALGPGAAELLAERVGPQLLWLRHELEKASLLAGPGEPVTRAHVAALTSDVAEEPIWDLTDAIGEGRSADALLVLHKLLAGGAPPIVVLGSLASHFRRLVRAGGGARIQAPPFVQRKLQGQASRYGPVRIVACLRALHEADERLKGQGALAPELALERLVLGLSA
jgi:DNA polymerase-3 subunit delta